MTYPPGRILEESAYIAYYFHWGHGDIMSLPHLDRQEWCRRIAAINKGLNHAPENAFDL